MTGLGVLAAAAGAFALISSAAAYADGNDEQSGSATADSLTAWASNLTIIDSTANGDIFGWEQNASFDNSLDQVGMSGLSKALLDYRLYATNLGRRVRIRDVW